jgi:hypothetical protein
MLGFEAFSVVRGEAWEAENRIHPPIVSDIQEKVWWRQEHPICLITFCKQLKNNVIFTVQKIGGSEKTVTVS